MRRLGLVVLALAVWLAGVVVWPTAAGAATGDGSGVSVARYGGADRYSTSLQVAEAVAAEAGGSLSSVVLVSGERWTDAVVAAPVAGALGAPVLMTPPGELRADALAFLQRVGVSDAVVIGPETGGGVHGAGRGVSAAVLAALDEADIGAERIAGGDRYETSVAAAGEVTAGVMPGLGRTAIVASAEVFADALVAGPFAARGTHPVLLSAPGGLPASVASHLSDADIEHVVVMGGTAALSADVETAIKGLGAEVTRLAGKTRYDTAVKAAELVTSRYDSTAGEGCFRTSAIGVARARVPFDSFSAAPLLSRLCAPLLLADPKQIPTDTAVYLDAARESNATVDLRVFGGDAAVSQTAIDAYLAGEDGGEGADASESDEEVQDAVPVGLAAGACGGSVDDEPRELLDSDHAEDPAWSPDCGRIVFSFGGSLWMMDNDGTNRQRLTSYDGAHSDEPVWSPDGTQIAYSRGQRNDDGHWFSHVYVINVDGTGRTKLSKGDVWDAKPSWSPDGSRIAFQRRSGGARDEDGDFTDPTHRVVVVNADGTSPATLGSGGWHGSPAWSPDGSRIAYVDDSGVIWLIDPDGTPATRVIAGVFWDGGLSWSPDGRRIAFARGDWTEASIVIADLDRAHEETVTDLGGLNAVPRWSPDGQRIAFTHFPDGRDLTVRSAYVTGASGTATGVGSGCRPRGAVAYDVTAGFPLSRETTPSVGTVRVAVLFMDYPDAQATHTTQHEASFGLSFVEEYLEAASYGRLDVELVPHHEWLRAEHSYTHYSQVIEVVGRSAIIWPATAHAVELADDDVDFSDIDMVLHISPSTHFSSGNAHRTAVADGATLRLARVGTEKRSTTGEPFLWGHTAAHELTHLFGLLDLYPYDAHAHDTTGAVPRGKTRVDMWWGLMGLQSWFFADSTDLRLRHTWRHGDGRTDTGYNTYLEPHEMLAWSRWQLGWLDESHVRCINETEATVSLAPIAEPDDGIAMAAVPLNGREVIVIESRRKQGYDHSRHYTAPNGWSTTYPRLITEGVLVYTVDTLIRSGELPLKVAGDTGNGHIDDFPVLQAGESITVRGYTITVTADDGNTHKVKIERDR